MPAIVALLAVIVILAAIIWRQQRALRALAAESRHDPLTGLPNRRALQAHWERMSAAPSLILIDLIGFKAVNDRHGHIVGDTLLQQVARRLETAVPAPGLLARWGGDEFAALVPADEVSIRLQRFEEALRPPFDLSCSGGPAEVRISARTGVANDVAALAGAEEEAARALLCAKADGASGEGG